MREGPMIKSNTKNQNAKLQTKIQKFSGNFKFWFVILVFGSWFLNCNGYAETVSSSELITHARQYDGKDIVYKGEVIGDIMPRGDFVWINVQDEANTIGVWAPKELTEAVEQKGDYQHKGDTVEIEGRFFRADPELQGEIGIRAQKIKIIQPGYRIFHVVGPAKVDAAVALSVTALCLGALNLYIKRKR